MCGISLAINTRQSGVPESLIKGMNDLIAHRGPDDEGYYYSHSLAMGHRRLAIIDLSEAGHQPMQRGQLTISYNGEIYNYLELRQELCKLGHNFKTATDTEVVLAAYQVWGVESFRRFNGMWAFILFDQDANELILCRDHFGIKPLCYTHSGEWFLAGSEIKQFQACSEFKSILNKKTTFNFLALGLLNDSNETFFQNVFHLPAGHYLSYNLSSHQYNITAWYQLSEAISACSSDNYDTAVLKVEDLFTNSLRLRMRSDVRVGSCLSGGIDSSSIVCKVYSEQLANPDFATITSSYKENGYNEEVYSDAVSQATGIAAFKVYPDLTKFWVHGDMDKMLYHQDQPVSSATHYSEFSVFDVARQKKMIVMLDGQGSDEFLCGYGEFYMTYVKELIRSCKIFTALRTLSFKAAHQNNHLIFQIFLFLKSAYYHSIIGVIKRFLGKPSFPCLSAEWQKAGEGHLKDYSYGTVRELSLVQMQHSSIPYQLHSEDRNSMMFSIESRLPFLDHRLVEYVISLPTEFKIREGYTKAVLRDAISNLPSLVRQRKDKMGFVAPDIPWIKANKQYVRANLKELVDNSDMFTEQLIARFDGFIDGTLGYDPIFFRALALNRFCKIFNMSIER
jgi:asparagine synthase (glutamine-hydrolysing)